MRTSFRTRALLSVLLFSALPALAQSFQPREISGRDGIPLQKRQYACEPAEPGVDEELVSLSISIPTAIPFTLT